MANITAIFRREMSAYFSTPVAYVFIVIFLLMAGAFTFFLGAFFDRGQADLNSLFQFLPWLFVILVPAIAMRLWAEEIDSGTVELLMTLPMTTTQIVIGKFLAAWSFTTVALALTFPLWITINMLGNPDNGAVLAGYIGAVFMAGGYLAVGSFVSAMTRSQVIAFVVSVALCFALTAAGTPLVLNFFSGWAGDAVLGFIRSISFLSHFEAITKGVVDLRDAVFFLSLIGVFLVGNVLAVNRFKDA